MRLNRNQILVFGLVVHLLASFFSVGFHHCDEKFQIFEFAGYKLGLNNSQDLPWEFHNQMRSGVQPFIVFIFTKTIWLFYHASPFFVAFLIRLFQGLISYYACVELFKLFENEIKSDYSKRLMLFFLMLGWCMPYLHVRFSSETFSVALFIIGFVQLMNAVKNNKQWFYYVWSGFFIGVAFSCRFQTAFMAFGLFLWLICIQKAKLKRLVWLAIGALSALVVGALADKWLYGKWTISWWNYLDLNFFQGRASEFGESPIYFYILQALLQLIPPFSLILLIALIGFMVFYKKHVVTWLILPFILLHFFVAHKEIRFLFPVINFLPMMVVMFFEEINSLQAWKRMTNLIRNKKFASAAFIINYVLLLFFTLKPAEDTTADMKTIYELTDNKPTLIIYENLNPYNAITELNYFKKDNVKSIHLDSLNIDAIKNKTLFYYCESTYQPSLMVKSNMVFSKVYSKFPEWFKYLNFNGWLDRSGRFSIYRKTDA